MRKYEKHMKNSFIYTIRKDVVVYGQAKRKIKKGTIWNLVMMR